MKTWPSSSSEVAAESPLWIAAAQSRSVALAPIVRQQLRQEGLWTPAVDEVPGAPFSDRDRFFSFRRDGKVGGRHYSAIVASARRVSKGARIRLVNAVYL